MNRRTLTPLLVIAAGLLAYHNSFTGPFIYDDEPSILTNRTIRHLWPISRVLSPPHEGGITVEGRPVINLSLAINYALGKTAVWGYHATNLAIHILAALTLLGIVRRTLRQPIWRGRFSAVANGLALATAIIWMVHPLVTESVTYIVQRAESIMGLLYLLTLYCFIRGAESAHAEDGRWRSWGRLWYGLSVAACALGMASKEVMVTAPLMVLLYDRTFLSSTFREAWRRRWPLYLGLAATWVLLGFVLVHGQLPATSVNARRLGVRWWQYFLTEPGVILHYLRLSVWPHPLCFDYYGWPIAATWTSILPPALGMAILLGATAWALKTNSGWGFVGAWFFLILAPTSSVVPLDSPAYEHRMYLPLAAVVVVVVFGIHALTSTSRSGLMDGRSAAVFAAVAIVLGFLTWRRNQDYRSELTIWQDTVAKRPDNPRAYTNLGLALVHAGQVQEAIGFYEQALRLKPDSDEARYNLEVALGRTSKPEEAIGHYEQALQLKPDSADAYDNLGLALAQASRAQEAIGYFEQATRLDPDDADAYNNLAVALIQLGKTAEAVDRWSEALRLRPDDVELQCNLANALLTLGKVPEAIQHWQQALALNPNFAPAHNSLGLALERSGRISEAIAQFEQAIRLQPDHPEPQNNLAWLLATLAPADGGDPARALSLAEQVCEITNHRVGPYLDTLAAAYATVGRFKDAIDTAEQADQLARSAGQTQAAQEIEHRLELYRSGRAYRQR